MKMRFDPLQAPPRDAARRLREPSHPAVTRDPWREAAFVPLEGAGSCPRARRHCGGGSRSQ